MVNWEQKYEAYQENWVSNEGQGNTRVYASSEGERSKSGCIAAHDTSLSQFRTLHPARKSSPVNSKTTQ